jgi:pimeloyl-ACP methyl ester carboxylesterase
MLGSPGNWSSLIDRLSGDVSAREQFQFLTFRYDSLQPIAESGRQLVEVLTVARRRADPEGRDDSFDRVVLVGHSLGGLVAKQASVGASGRIPGGPAGPHFGRLIFVATPHRGVPFNRGAVRSVGGWLARAVSPSIAAQRAVGSHSALVSITSVDELAWDHPAIQDLERATIATGIPSHSIIASLGTPTADGASDGLVPVASARLEGARSEIVVRAQHVCLQNPDVIREVQRILGEHVRKRTGSPSAVESTTAHSNPAAPPAGSLRSSDPHDHDALLHVQLGR